ncbi:MAG: carboxypeptidase-like regulatory domain-containing protein, partial [Candidatus Acidiferrales bacterium]
MIRFDHWLIGWAARMTTAGLLLAISGGAAFGQGSRKDDIVFGPSGHPVAGAIVTVCQSTATGTPCTPLATVYTDATLTVPSPNPFQTDGIGNYHFYAPAGRYLLQISGPGIQGTITYPDVILPADVSSSGAGNN